LWIIPITESNSFFYFLFYLSFSFSVMKKIIIHSIFPYVAFLFMLFFIFETNAQVSYTFTNASATGSLGPTQAQVNTAYASTNLSGSVTVNPQGIQNFTIPVSGGYRIQALGAQGYGTYGGRGAVMAGDFTLTAGTVLKIAVGQQAVAPNSPGTNQYGGGGGSFVTYTNNLPLVIAGGGGGSWATTFTGLSDGTVSASGNNGSNGPTNGSGGSAGSGGTGGGLGNGGAGLYGNGDGTGAAMSFTNGATGGSSTGHGGFGGGAGCSSQNNRRCGGGGGYSGGGGAGSTTTGYPEAGGGGSINTGVNQTNTSGSNLGQGRVIISELCSIAIYSSGSNSLSPVLCSGNSMTLTTNAVSGYSWSTGSTSSSIVVSPTSNTSYSLIATSSLACQASALVTVTVSSGVPSLTVSASSNTACLGSTVNLTATGAINYTWTNGVVNGVNFTPSVTNTYTVTGDNGCGTSTAVATISVMPLPVFASATSSIVCASNPATLTASGAGTYSWSTGQAAAVIIVTPSVNTSYTVTGQSGSCIGYTTISINTNPNPTLSINVTDSILCAGESSTISVSGASTYTWNIPGISGSSGTITPASSTLYQVSGTNSVGCITGISQFVTVNPLPVILAGVSPTMVCINGSATINAGGADVYSLNATPSGSSNIVNPSSTSTYTIAGSFTATGCSSTETVELVVFEPTLSISPSSTVCAGSVVTLSAGVASNYLWSNGSIFPAIIFTAVTSNMYSVSATSSSNGLICPVSNTVYVGVNPNPTVTASANRSVACRFEKVNLSGGGATSYTWTNFAGQVGTTAAVTVSSNINLLMVYTVTGMESTGCKSTATVSVQYNACIGLDETDPFSEVNIFPNPSYGSFNIRSSLPVHVKVFNELGQLIESIKMESTDNKNINVIDMEKGLYFIHLTNENDVIIKKVIVK
jgi:hypothetical protein